jgi:hypothetical protein
VPLGHHVPALDPPRQFDLLVGGEQLHPSDRAQVQAQRVEARLDRQVQLRLPRRVGRRRAVRRLRLLVGGQAVPRDHINPVLDQVGVQALDLLLGHLDLRERPRDLLERQVSPLTTLRDQPAQRLDVAERRLAVQLRRSAVRDAVLLPHQRLTLLSQSKPLLGSHVAPKAARSISPPCP